MFTAFDPHICAAAKTGLALAPMAGRGRIDADVALAGRMAR
jgi:hypothetical protein